MIAHDLVADMPSAPVDRREALLYFRVFLRYLYDSAPYAQLANGSGLCDGSDYRAWFLELAAEAAKVLELSRGTEVPMLAEMRTGPKVTPVSGVRFHNYRPEQPRWEKACPDCGHEHEEEETCGVDMGGGGFCPCPRRMSA